MGQANSNYKLLKAVHENDIQKVEKLLENGADIHFVSDEAIVKAVIYNRIEMVKLLIKNHADVNARDKILLFYASKFGYTEIVRLLLDNKADPNSKQHIIIRIARNNEIIQLLIDAGVNIDIVIEDMKSPQMLEQVFTKYYLNLQYNKLVNFRDNIYVPYVKNSK